MTPEQEDIMENTDTLEEKEEKLEKPDEQDNSRNPDGTFKEGYSGNPNGRAKGTRDWSTDFNEAIKKISEKTGVPVSEIRTDLLVKGITEARKGNHNFWKEIVERNYGKIPNDLNIGAGDGVAKLIFEVVNDKRDKNNEGELGSGSESEKQGEDNNK